MFCNNCGSQIDDKAVICPHYKGLALAGIIISAVSWGLVLILILAL